MTRRGLTYDEAVKLGLGSEHPDAPGQRRRASHKATRGARPQPIPGQPNKTEASYGTHLYEAQLAQRVVGYAFEPMKLRLAGRTWLKIDYAVLTPTRLLLIDVKGGPLEDSAAIKCKVCAERYPWMPLYLVYYERREWRYRPVSRSGIGPWCAEPF